MGTGAMCGEMAGDIRDTTSKTKNTDMESMSGQTGASMKETGPLENSMARASTSSPTEKSKLGSGTTERGSSGSQSPDGSSMWRSRSSPSRSNQSHSLTRSCLVRKMKCDRAGCPWANAPQIHPLRSKKIPSSRDG